jgi:solute carrier family 34 (sodium-dependent phosphate cotransporter)
MNRGVDIPKIAAAAEEEGEGRSHWGSWFLVVGLVYVLLVGVGAIGDGFKLATKENAAQLFVFAKNPLVGLIIGTVATALIQSSSTVSSIIVGLVAGGLPLAIAIPMVMGANIGTSLTSTLVSLGSIRHGEAFRRAFAAATVHDVFNLLAVAILLPLEVVFAPLAFFSGLLLKGMGDGVAVSLGGASVMQTLLGPGSAVVKGMTFWLPGIWQGVAMAVLGGGVILLVVTSIGRVMRRVLVGRAKQALHAAIGRGPLTGIITGAVITMMVQSSSTTTALMVPLAASGIFSLAQVYPFTLGANVGTTITALLAATAVVGPLAPLAMQIAVVHLLFNVLGIGIIFGLPFLRNLPIRGAEWLAEWGQRSSWYVCGYILGVFFVIPLALIGLSTMF